MCNIIKSIMKLAILLVFKSHYDCYDVINIRYHHEINSFTSFKLQYDALCFRLVIKLTYFFFIGAENAIKQSFLLIIEPHLCY